jgi:hypothetical protein
MSTDLKVLEAHVVFKNPGPGDRKKMVESMFPARFRTSRELAGIVDGWAKGQWSLMADLGVEVRKPDKRNHHWRAEVVHPAGVLAEIVFHAPHQAPALASPGLFE